MRIILVGSSGAMGRKIIKMSRLRGHEIVAGVDKSDMDDDFPVFEKPQDVNIQADMVIDFSHPHLLSGVLALCERDNLPLIYGTTGIGEDDDDRICELSKSVPVVRSSNFSFGISVVKSLLEKAAKLLAGNYDMEIIEMHHNQKQDAPSGTALMLYDILSANAGRKMHPVYSRCSGRRDKDEIGITSLRGGTVVGEHEVIFAGDDEVIKISHSAYSKEIFANGALIAAETILNKDHGYYTMDNIADMVMEENQ